MRIAALLLLVPALAIADTGPRGFRFDPSGLREISSFVVPSWWMPSPDGRYLALRDADLRIHDLAANKDLGALPTPATGIHDGAWSANGRLFAASGNDASVKVWSIPAMKELISVEPHEGYS